MNSSGIKRGLATVAISALAVTGLPFLATTASATPIADTLGDDAVAFYTQQVGLGQFSTKNDGTNTTASLVVGGGANVTSVIFQYQTLSNPGVWQDVAAAVARNADGVFKADWANPPADVTALRAVPNTGEANADDVTPATNMGGGATVDTVELGSEGSLGVFQAPYTEVGHTGDYVGVTGTVSQGSTAPNVEDRSHGTGGADTTTLETTADTASDTFNSVLDINGYPYSSGAEANQIAIGAETADTDDAEASTLYVQTIGSITATPATQEQVDPNNAEVVITVLDTTGKPVAGAQVFESNPDTDTDAGGPDTDTDGPDRLIGYTDGRGQVKDSAITAAGTYNYYVNTTDADEYNAGTDPTTSSSVTTYTPTLAEVDIVNERNRSNFDDTDELNEGVSDDFSIETRDQRGNLFDEDGGATNNGGSDIEYRYIIDPSGPGATTTTPWMAATDNGDGTWSVNDPGPVADGTVTLEARRPNVAGSGLRNATPETVNVGESDVEFDGGNQENAPVNGSYTATGTVANATGGLGGREVQLTYSSTGDSAFAPQAQQPAGVTVTGPGTATAVTDANGNFAVKINDPGIPANVTPTPETGTLTATDVQETATDTTPLGASDSLTINWQEQPDADDIIIDVDELLGTAGPGAPVDLDIEVQDADNNTLVDYPVEVTVDRGFLSPNAEVEDDLTLADGHDQEGDLWGFFQNDGQSETVSTGDAGDAGIVAAMERDADFDDDGLSTMTITVTAGDVTETREVTFDVRVLLNSTDESLERAASSPQGNPVSTEEDVDFQLYVHDQFGNLAGDTLARISDDSTVADFETDEDFDRTLSDFTTSGPGITAFSNAPATQTLFAAMSPGENVVDNNGDRDPNARNISVASGEIQWVEPTVEKVNASLELKGNDNGAANDSLLANAINKTAGAEVKLFRKRADGTWKFLRSGIMNEKGNYRFKNVNDKNGNGKTRYKAVVKPTELTRRGVGKVTVR